MPSDEYILRIDTSYQRTFYILQSIRCLQIEFTRYFLMQRIKTGKEIVAFDTPFEIPYHSFQKLFSSVNYSKPKSSLRNHLTLPEKALLGNFWFTLPCFWKIHWCFGFEL